MDQAAAFPLSITSATIPPLAVPKRHIHAVSESSVGYDLNVIAYEQIAEVSTFEFDSITHVRKLGVAFTCKITKKAQLKQPVVIIRAPLIECARSITPL